MLAIFLILNAGDEKISDVPLVGIADMLNSVDVDCQVHVWYQWMIFFLSERCLHH